MDNFEELTLKVEKIIEEEKATNPDIKYLNSSHSKIIAQIISNYELSQESLQNKSDAKMIFLGAPTGAGKDTLVRKIILENPDRNFVVLNMDMFRYYHDEILDSHESISDKDFALKTNQTSYELYYIIQEIVLREFPGTDVIVTGTMKDLNWVKEIVDRYKNDEKTNYSISLLTLAVPKNESAFSIFERYLNMVNTRGTSEVPLRYTDLTYHNATIKDFISNVQFFENEIKSNSEDSRFDSIKVYRRNKDMFNLSENTLIYDSENSNQEESATQAIYEIMSSNKPIDNNRVYQLLNIIKQNADYLKSQGLYKDVLLNLQKILPQLNKIQDYDDVGK